MKETPEGPTQESQSELEISNEPTEAGEGFYQDEEGKTRWHISEEEGDAEDMWIPEGDALYYFNDKGIMQTGVKGMDLPEGEKVVGMITSLEGDKIFSLSANGYGKITPGSEYRITSRGSKGVKTMRVEDKNGALIAIKTVKGDEDIIIITDHGTTIRTTLTQVSNMSRNTIGVKRIRI